MVQLEMFQRAVTESNEMSESPVENGSGNEGVYEILTSCYGRLKQIPKGFKPVSISRGTPAWFHGAAYPKLAPHRNMLKMQPAQYDSEFEKILDNLNPLEVIEELHRLFGPKIVLLCWEAPNVACHRRIVAEWLEAELGDTITELGFDREQILDYADSPQKT